MGLLKEFWLFLRVRKKWWLLPIIIVMVLLGTLLVFAQGSALAPFIYTIFQQAFRTEETQCEFARERSSIFF